MDRIQRIGDVAEIMLDYVENKKTYQADNTMRVPTRSYTDHDQWRAEMELIFKRVPLMLAFTAEMPNPGDYKAMEAVGLPILISRDKEGKVRAFLNVCSHRSAPVASEGHGNCPRFVCKYHGWTFGQDGRLIGVAESRTFGDVDKAGLGLRRLPCEEKAGMIFVCLTPNAPMDLDRYFRGFLDDYDAMDFGKWTYLGSRVIEGANWKIAFDGYLEGYHFASLHPETIFPRTPSNCTHYEGFGPNIRIGFPQKRIAEALRDKTEAVEHRNHPGADVDRQPAPGQFAHAGGPALPRADAGAEPDRAELSPPRSDPGRGGSGAGRDDDRFLPRRDLQGGLSDRP